MPLMADALTCVRCHETRATCRLIAGTPYCLRCRRVLVSDRGLAFFFEAVMPIAVLNLGVTGLSTGLGVLTMTAGIAAGVLTLAYLAWLVYFLIKDGLRGGQSVGKRWRHLRVITERGDPCSRWQSFVRNVILVIPFVAWAEVVVMLWRSDGRRFGDLLAKTCVVACEHSAGATTIPRGG